MEGKRELETKRQRIPIFLGRTLTHLFLFMLLRTEMTLKQHAILG